MPRKNPHPHVAWRDGRPRFQPGRDLRAAGHKGKDLRHEDGRWFTRGEAVDWSEAFRKQLAADKAATASRSPAGGRAQVRRNIYTVEKLFDDWYRSPKFTQKRPHGYAENTIRDYRQKARVLEEEHALIWNAPVAALERHMLRAAFEELWTKRGLATAKGAMLTLSTAISWAMLRGRVRIAVNPALRLKMASPAPRVRFGTRREIEALVAMADAIGWHWAGDMIVLAVWTGQRQADRLALVDKGLLNNRRFFRQAKTGAVVAIRQVDELERRLAAARARRAAARAAALLAAKTEHERAAAELRFAHVILDERTWQPIRKYRWTHLFAELREAAVAGSNEHGLAPCRSLADFWDLDLRDTAVTWMALAGATIPEIVAVTGHSIESATRILKHYLARHPEMADSALRKMVEWYDAGGETEIGL